MKRILIYNDLGVSKKAFNHAKYSLSLLFETSYLINSASAADLSHSSWMKNTALLVLPGGKDVPYVQKLKGQGNQNIRQFVEEGGSILGICAGAYYCGESIEFALNTPLEICQKRPLHFFPGVVRGPILASYDYHSLRDVRAAKIYRQNQPFFYAYYHGGGYFVQADTKPNTTVIATYDREKKFPAIIECKIGKGKAILSGVHFEYAPEKLDINNQYLKKIIPKLNSHNAQRLNMFKYSLSRLAM